MESMAEDFLGVGIWNVIKTESEERLEGMPGPSIYTIWQIHWRQIFVLVLDYADPSSLARKRCHSLPSAVCERRQRGLRSTVDEVTNAMEGQHGIGAR
jgi:hypothetical protein